MSYRPFLGLALLAAGCVAQDPAQNTFPEQWDNQPQYVSGPPGGQADPGYGYQQPGYDPQQPQGYPQGYPEGYPAPSTEDQAAADTATQPQMPEPSSDPQDPGYDMGAVTDPEIDATLDGYGSWEDNPDYGRVWRPNTTTVGVDFTPYETCGTWVWSDWGWNYSCDWSWGWLPFHYGRWGWFDGYWGWVPGHEWGPAWVEWRHGGGYVGWRPLGPQIRDHRGEHDPPTFHDHRTATAHDSHWRFASEGDFGRNHIHGHLFANPAEGLRVTQPVTRPSIRGNYAPVSSASLMRARLSSRYSNMHASQGGWRQPAPGTRNQGWRSPQQPANQGWRSPQAVNQGYRANETPTWRPRQQPQTWQQPQQTWQRPQQTWQRPQQPPQGWRQPQQTWQRPQQTWQRPQQTWRPPAQTYRPPSSSWSAPSHSSWSAPSHSSSSGGGGFHSSGGGGFHSSGGGGGGGHSSGGGGGHSGGGGHHR